jgi:hypothetical protein
MSSSRRLDRLEPETFYTSGGETDNAGTYTAVALRQTQEKGLGINSLERDVATGRRIVLTTLPTDHP